MSGSSRTTLAVNGLLLKADGIHAGYGKLEILHGVSLEIWPGSIVSVIGPNGAGKSTAFKAIVGLVPPKSGRILFDGQDITGIPPYKVLRRGAVRVCPRPARL